MTQNLSNHSNVNELLPDLLVFLQDVVQNETLSENALEKCGWFIEELEDFVKKPCITEQSNGELCNNESENQNSVDFKIETPKTCKEQKQIDEITSLEFLHQQRELARQGTIWRDDNNRPKFNKPYDDKQTAATKSSEVINTPPSSKKESKSESIYERIGSVGNVEEVIPEDTTPTKSNDNNENTNGAPPKVPERKGRTASSAITPKSPLQQRARTATNEVVMVHDLKTPLYSGLLRNVQQNIKQWCVIKKQKLYLFNDLRDPADFVADLQEFEIFKDMSDTNAFRVSRIGEPSLILAAVDDEQYELWNYAFKRAKVLADTMEGTDQEDADLQKYLIFRGSEYFEESSNYEKPEDLMEISAGFNEKSKDYRSCGKPPQPSPTEDYVPMDGFVNRNGNSIPPMSPINYEIMDHQPHPPDIPSYGADYSSMPLPPLPGSDFPQGETPELPPRRTRAATYPSNATIQEKEDETSSLSGSGSFEEMDESEIYNDQSKQSNTLVRKIKSRNEKEIEFLHDISAVFCGILHQRRMLAVWQKRFCKVKDQALICYRSPDAAEPVLKIELSDYQIDRADEAWKSNAFKMFKDSSDVLYFAAETRTDLVKWLNILVKETKKKKMNEKNSLDVTDKIAIAHAASQDSLASSIDDISMAEDEDNISSEFDADNESVDSANEDIPSIITKNKFLRVNKAGKKARRRTETLKDPAAEVQGHLYRKLNNHWSKRWCSIKDEKFVSYKRSIKEPPEFIVLLQFAALALPTVGKNDESFVKSTSNQYFFKLRYEGDISMVFRTNRKEDWSKWITCLGKYIGSQSEEEFHYINVAPSVENENRKSRSDASFPQYDTQDAYSLIPDDVPVNTSFARDPSFKLPPRAPVIAPNYHDEPPERHSNELNQCIYSGILTELQIYNQAFRHIERFAVLTDDKWFKLYQNVTSPAPVAWFSGLDIDVVEEAGADASVLRLLIQLSGTELVFKTSDDLECMAWKNAFSRLHYEEIDEFTAATNHQQQQEHDVKSHEKIFRKRSKSIDRKDKTEPVLLSHSKTLPHMGKLKKNAREGRKADKEKSRTLPNEALPVSTSSRKSFSALLRSFTVDTIGRKAKNKSYELSKDGTIATIKETQHGQLDELMIDDLGNNLLVTRFCRISGKVFYAYENEHDTKPVMKIPLRNAAIEDYAELENNLFQFKITEMDTGKEFTFCLSTEELLDAWMGALFGEDQLHKSLDNSPNTSSLSINTDVNRSPRSNRASSLLETTSSQQPIIKTTSPVNESNEDINDYHQKQRLIGSVSSLQSTSRSTISESDTPLSPIATSRKSIDGNVIAKSYMFEYHESAKTKSRRWVVLTNDQILIYRNDADDIPINMLELYEYTLVNNESKGYNLKLKHKLGGITEYIVPTEAIYKLWVKHLKLALKKKNSTSKTPVILRNRNLLVDRLKLSEKDKRASMVLIPDDVKAIEEYEKTADPAKIMSGLLHEYLDDVKMKERTCWIKAGFFYIAKRSKPDKPIKVIDLSTVVILDESDASINRFCFKLEYLTSNKTCTILLRAQNEHLADKWMVAVSMGILFHRMSTNARDSHRESKSDDDNVSSFHFVKLGDDTEADVLRKTRKDSQEQKLGYDIKRAISKKAQHGESHLQSVSEHLNSEFPSPGSSPLNHRKNIISDGVDGETIDAEGKTHDILELPTVGDGRKSLSLITDEDDKVFNETNEPSAEELLENIPERENADETFKNIKGILRQQESIRRAILKRQRNESDVSLNGKKIPPVVKPKPKLLRPYSNQQKCIVLKKNLEELSMNDLHSYKEELEEEKSHLLLSIKKMNIVVSEARTNLKRSLSMRENSTSSEKELNVVTVDLQTLQKRFQRLERELKTISTSINRKVAITLTSRRRSNVTWYGSANLLDKIDSCNERQTLAPPKSPNQHEDGYNSEPILDDKFFSKNSNSNNNNSDRDSIIV